MPPEIAQTDRNARYKDALSAERSPLHRGVSALGTSRDSGLARDVEANMRVGDAGKHTPSFTRRPLFGEGVIAATIQFTLGSGPAAE